MLTHDAVLEEEVRCAASTQWIGGAARPSRDSARLVLLDPATGEPVCEYPRGGPEDVATAVDSARKARDGWRSLGPLDRTRALRAAIRKMEPAVQQIARLVTIENGRPLPQTVGEVQFTMESAETLLELGLNFASRHMGARAGELVFQQWQPRGVVACISTWNYPIIVSMEMALSALILGNTIVLKSSERTPLATRVLFEKMFAHLPPGVANLLNGDGANVGQPLVCHPGVDVVAFVGSIPVGRQIGRMAGERVKKAILELGGKDALIVDETVDIPAAARLAATGCFANCGQICTSIERIYVIRKVHDEFVDKLATIARTYRLGPGLNPDVDMGPMIGEDIRRNVERQVESAVQKGAEIVAGGQRLNRPGFFYPPTVMTKVPQDTPLMEQETYGPVAPVMAVDSFEEAMEQANRTEFGLSATVCTENPIRAMAAIEQLEAGMVRINAPRGPVVGIGNDPVKQSGIGVGRGLDFMRELVIVKGVHWRSRLE